MKNLFVSLTILFSSFSATIAAEIPFNSFSGKSLNILIKTGYESSAITKYESYFENVTGIDLNIEVVDEPTLRKKIILDATSKSGAYDIVATQFWYMPEYINIGYFENLNNLMKNKSLWYSIDDIPSGHLATYKDKNNNLYAVPVSASGGVLMYRKDIFDKLSLKYPQNTSDVMDAAKVIKNKMKGEIVPFIGRGDSSSASFGSSVGWAYAYGAKILKSNNEANANSAEMKRAMKDWVSLMKDYGPKDAATMTWSTMGQMFVKGGAAMNFDMSGFPSYYMNPEVSKVAKNVGVTLLKGPSNNYAQWMYGEGLGISKYSPNKEAAWLFLQWRTSLQTAKKEINDGLRNDIPINTIFNSEVYKNKTTGDEFAKILPHVLSSVDTSYWPNIAKFDKLAQTFQQQISLAISGDKNVNEALDQAQKDIKPILN